MSADGLDYSDPRINQLAEAASHIGDRPVVDQTWVKARRVAAYKAALQSRSRARWWTLLAMSCVFSVVLLCIHTQAVTRTRLALNRIVGSAHVASVEGGLDACGHYRLPIGLKLRFVYVGGVLVAETPEGRWRTRDGYVIPQEGAYRACADRPSEHPILDRLQSVPLAAIAVALFG